jgi:hypothetical protein
MKRFNLFLICVLFALGLSACGGGGGGSSDGSSSSSTPTPDGSSNWDQMTWDQSNWS